MKKFLVLLALVFVPMLASLDASAMTVEARGFALCTAGHDASGLCLAGSFFSGRADAHPGYPSATLIEETWFVPDWGTANAERWKPGGTTSITGSTGVNWTCCVELGASESWSYVTTAFQVWAMPPGSGSNVWVTAEWSGFIGWDDDTYSWCANSDAAVFQGKQDSYTPTSYSTNMRIARCKATYNYPPVGPYWHGIEYWMD